MSGYERGVPVPPSASIIKMLQYHEIALQRVISLQNAGEEAVVRERLRFIEALCHRTLEVVSMVKRELMVGDEQPPPPMSGDFEADVLRDLANLPQFDK